MKKILTLLMLAILMLSLVSCKNTNSATTSPSVTPAITPEATPEATPEPVIEQEDPFKWYAEYDKNAAKGYNSYALVGVDEFGRAFSSVSSQKEDKTVGMFYHLSQGFHESAKKGIFDVMKITEQYGSDVIFKEESAISPNLADHFWGEPLWGYYKSDDSYVLRKQLEMFTLAGVDYLVLDVTNGWTYLSATRRLMRYIEEARADGWDAPQIVFYVHSLNNKTVRELYDNLYAKGYNQGAWYMRDGKPVIIAYDDTEKDKAEAKTRGVTDFSSPDYAPLSQEILDFFYFVEPRWPNDIMPNLVGTPIFDKDKKTGFCWIEWTQPLPVRQTSLGSFVNVAVASHPSIPFSFSITRNARNWGRGYDPKTGQSTEDGIYQGTYFQACWDQALQKDPDTVFLVMWNGWVALKQPWDGEYMLCDTADLEYSLTIEPSKGYYNDAYYIQMLDNMRKYKFEGTNETHIARTIDINGTYAQWYNVDAVYRQFGKESYGRNNKSVDGSISYEIEKPKNNIQEVRISHDANYLYFMIRTEEAITSYDGSNNWMNLFIGTDTPSLKGWNSYEYVINRSVNGTSSDIIKLNADFSGSSVGTADIKVNGEFMFLRVPREAVGLKDINRFYFKVADSVAKPEDIMEYYVSGSVLPLGRLSYEYIGR